MYDIVAQTVIAFFLVGYSALFMALVWWVLGAPLSLAVKNGIGPVRARLVGRRVHSGRVGCCLSVMLLSALILCGPYGFAHESEASPAATASIEGAVAAGGEGESMPVPGVPVKLTSTSPGQGPFSTTTDTDGRYQFTQLAPGVYKVEVGLEGFRTFTGSVALKQGEVATNNIRLELDKIVQQVEVQDKATPVATETSDSTATVSNRQITTLPLAEQKFTAVLPLVPGVVRTSDGKLNMKGEVENQGMLLVDSAQSVDPVTGSFSIPVPIDAIQSLNVDKTPYSSEYGGFSGGLAAIETRPPSGNWHYGMFDPLPGLRGKNGHLVGVSDWTPRFFFGGPILKNKLSFSEALTYDVRKRPVRGLPWPYDETKQQGFDSLTSFQAVLSPQHILSVSVNGFSNRKQFADISALTPQTASSDQGQRGVSVGGTDSYQFSSGALLSTVFRYTRFDSNAHGQGPQEMMIGPEGWSGNFFDAWTRSANQVELLPIFQFAQKEWFGRHQFKVGVDLNHRSYSGTDHSHAIQLTRQDGSLGEQINFQGGGRLSAQDTEVSEFLQDDWRVNDRLSLNLGGRLSTQSMGRSAAIAPRAGFVYAPGEDRKTVIRGGAGLFYGRVPLQAADFLDNPTRVVSLYDGSGQIASPVVFQNAYVTAVPGRGLVPTGRDLDSSPRNFTANLEVDREIRRNVVARFSYLYSRTQDLYIVTPLAAAPGSASLLGLAHTGDSHYREFEATVHYQAGERSELNVSYVRSQARGDLNTLSDIYVPFEAPVIRPDVTGNLASNVPNRLVSWGAFGLPWNITLSPVVDVRSGLPYSNVDTLQSYVGEANSQRFPTFFSFDLKGYREFKLPFFSSKKNRRVRIGLYMINLTNHSNPLEVYNNITSPYFGHFVGFQHRVNGFVIDIVN
ncbi:MAG TPA: TonB-dependent receptor [Terriglobia bacterium]|nr:TonB-dependent receptor [Terriglobia bacterium]